MIMNERDNHILVVDDEPSNIQLIGKILEMSGYSVHYAMDGKSSLELVKKFDIDLILLDVMLPDLDGFEVCTKLMDDENTQDIPIIFITARSEIENITRGFQLGGVDYVTKPFNEAELTARIKTHLELKNKRDHLKKELINREKMISDSVVFLTGRNEWIIGIIDALKDLDQKTGRKYHTEIRELQKQMRKLTEGQQSKELEIQFNQLHREFQHNLLRKFPALTQKEVRLCGFLRLNMTSKEVSKMTGQSIRAVEAARSRLRKRLRLKKEDNLATFLNSI